MIKTIKVDWNDIKSVKKAERDQARLFNAGYKVIKTESKGLNITILTLKDIK